MMPSRVAGGVAGGSGLLAVNSAISSTSSDWETRRCSQIDARRGLTRNLVPKRGWAVGRSAGVGGASGDAQARIDFQQEQAAAGRIGRTWGMSPPTKVPSKLLRVKRPVPPAGVETGGEWGWRRLLGIGIAISVVFGGRSGYITAPLVVMKPPDAKDVGSPSNVSPIIVKAMSSVGMAVLGWEICVAGQDCGSNPHLNEFQVRGVNGKDTSEG